MLYVYYGTDTDTARAKVRATTEHMLAKHPDALSFRVTADTLDQHSFEELTQSQGLFKREYIVLLDHVFEHPDGEARVLEVLEALAAAPHPFFVLEGALRAPTKRKLEKHATAIHEFAQQNASQRRDAFNTFALSDALGARDRKQLWVLFRQAKQRSVADEEILGILFWMLKAIVIAGASANPEAANMKPYPFNKAKRFARNYAEDELSARIRELALMPTTARRRGTPLEISLERFILTSV